MLSASSENQGFTLIEILLVIVIMGLMLAVIVPRGQRASIDSKYSLVRQAATELSSFANQWTESQMEAQPEDASSTLNDYFISLSHNAQGTGPDNNLQYVNGSYSFIPNPGNNWTTATQGISGRGGLNADDDTLPEIAVSGLIPQEKTPRNPFNGASYFRIANDGTDNVIPGGLALLAVDYVKGEDTVWHYYAFIYQGTDSQTANEFHGGMGTGESGQKGKGILSIANARNGIFVGRTR